jgi:hypothetical protein
MKAVERQDNTNARIARSIILSKTNPTMRGSLLWIFDIEKAIIKALDAKDVSVIRGRVRTDDHRIKQP